MNKEERKIYMKAWRQTPIGKKASRKNGWRRAGIIVDNNDYDTFYDHVLSITNCQLCNKELTYGKKSTHSTRCVDHDHGITDRPNVRAICCHTCNLNDQSSNKSGEPNIFYNKANKNWAFSKTTDGKKYYKSGFKTFALAVQYKYKYLSQPLL
mgnify:CR=1 FL=1|tara:strand:- start:134 stop:592 length:459 start_codon:yes stop_codon:yes gene_type:complete